MTKEETLDEIKTLIANNIKDLTNKLEKDEISIQSFNEKIEKIGQVAEYVKIYFEMDEDEAKTVLLYRRMHENLSRNEEHEPESILFV